MWKGGSRCLGKEKVVKERDKGIKGLVIDYNALCLISTVCPVFLLNSFPTFPGCRAFSVCMCVCVYMEVYLPAAGVRTQMTRAEGLGCQQLRDQSAYYLGMYVSV